MNRNTITGLPSATIAFTEFFLLANQIEAGSVAHVLKRPCLARGLLVAADGQHDDVSLLRDS